MWVVTQFLLVVKRQMPISIHTTRVGGDSLRFVTLTAVNSISIHTTRVGGDSLYCVWFSFEWISIHTTRVGGDPPDTTAMIFWLKFQSTPPVWVVT